MVKQNSNKLSKILLFVIALMLTLTSVFALSNTTVFAEEKTGISLSKPITTYYYKDQKITIDGKEYTDIPEVEGGQLDYQYQTSTGAFQTRTVDILQAVKNQIKSESSKDRIKFENFSTVDNVGTDKVTKKTMTLRFYPASSSESYEINIPYSVYSSVNDVNGMQQQTKILSKINSVLDNVLAPLLIVMASVGMIFAIFLGIKLARANNAEEREEAKKRVIYTVVGIAICVALIIIFKLFAKFSIEWFGDSNFFELPITKK